MVNSLLLYNIGQLLTMRGCDYGPLAGSQMSSYEVLTDAAVFIENGLIADIGPSAELQERYSDAKVVVDAKGKMVTPGLIDPHTHLVHASSREAELEQKLAGVPYLDILAQGGGILSTVSSTRAASATALLNQAKESLKRMNGFGVTTVEAKSGYGLDWETEHKQLAVARELADLQPVRLVSTFLGAHAIPPEFKGRTDAFVDEVLQMIDKVSAENLAEFCDVFCEQGVFSVEQSRKILQKAQSVGLGAKVHADEIVSLGGAELAAQVGAVTADHLVAASDDGLAAMAQSGTIPVVLPGTSWNLGKNPAPLRRMIDVFELPVAVATDYNPGSCPTENLQLVMAFACHLAKMTPIEAMAAVTRNAAFAVGRGNEAGVIDVNRPADIVLWNADNPAYLIYHFGINHVESVWINGQQVVEGGVATWA